MDRELYEQIHQIENSHWWYAARRKIIYDWVFKTLAINDTQKILDVGCGTGFNIEYVQTKGFPSVVGLDLSKDALNFCKMRNLSDLICCNAITIPLVDKSFDVVLALDLLEHLENDVQAIHEFARIIKPGGKLFLFVPAYQILWGLQDVVGHHFRRYTAREIQGKVLNSNLMITKLTYVNTFLFPLIWMGRIALRILGNRISAVSENDLSPDWSNDILMKIFGAERPLINHINLPFGVSIFCIAQKHIDENLPG